MKKVLVALPLWLSHQRQGKSVSTATSTTPLCVEEANQAEDSHGPRRSLRARRPNVRVYGPEWTQPM
jgi:hypothetical protein